MSIQIINKEIMEANQIIKPDSSLKKGFRNLNRQKALYVMLLPGMIALLIFSYLPMPGVLIAFKDFRYSGKSIFTSFMQSDWVGFKNFRFLFKTPDAFTITRNTLLYNLAFIVLGLIVSVFVAIALSEVRNKIGAKFYQSAFFLPYFLSWVIVGLLGYTLFSEDLGVINLMILKPLGIEQVSWYTEPGRWPIIIILVNLWKYTGYNSVVYLASIMGIDSEYYEAAEIDGASKSHQIRYITIPLLVPLMTILSIMAVGRIFNADFGLFFYLPLNSGPLFSTTNVIDTYVYRAMLTDIGMSSAAGLYQAVFGFVLVFTANMIVRKINKENALF